MWPDPLLILKFLYRFKFIKLEEHRTLKARPSSCMTASRRDSSYFSPDKNAAQSTQSTKQVHASTLGKGLRCCIEFQSRWFVYGFRKGLKIFTTQFFNVS